MRLSAHRLPACVVLLALLTASTALCEGWRGSQAARMACCVARTSCPMHASGEAKAVTPHHVSQSEADSCCASSERDGSAPSPAGVAVASPLTVVVSPVVIVLDPLEKSLQSLRLESVPLADVPRHLLLTVLQV